MNQPNNALRRARERLPSGRVPGCPMSRGELASKVNAWLREETGQVYALDERAIGRWERGAVRRPSTPYLAALRAVLGVEHDWELGLGDPPTATSEPAAPATDSAPPTVAAIRMMASSFHVVDRKLGGGQLYSTVVGYLQNEVARALFTSQGGTQIYAAAASLTEIAGWMAHDSGRDRKARGHFDASYRLSLAAGSAALAANMCASMSHLASHLGQANDAIRLADVGLDRVAETGGVARVAARLHAMRAKGRAMRRDADGCLSDLRLAEGALNGGNDNEHAVWTAHFDEGSLAAETATALHVLGDLESAERHAGHAVELRGGDRVRARAFGHLTLASIKMDAGRVDEAATLGRAVCQVAPTLSSARVHARLVDLASAVRRRPQGAETTAFLGEIDNLDAGSTVEAVNPWPV